MIGIYKITNKLNGKSYIGQSIHCDKRYKEHCRGKNQFIDETIQIEGEENFEFELLEECKKEQLNEREDYYIKKYNTMFPNGYNKRWNTSSHNKLKRNISFEDFLSSEEIFYKDWYIKIYKILKRYYSLEPNAELRVFTYKELVVLLNLDSRQEKYYIYIMYMLKQLEDASFISLKKIKTKDKYTLLYLINIV